MTMLPNKPKKKPNKLLLWLQKKIKNKRKVTYSKDFLKYQRKQTLNRFSILLIQLLLLVVLFGSWELLAKWGLINTFIMSSPSRIFKTLVDYNFLLNDIVVTLNEAIISFTIATVLGTVIAIGLWWNNYLRKVLDPYIVVLNSLPKIALGPIIIIWVGIGTSAIVVMAVLIMIIITILSMLHTFMATDKNKILLLQSMNASKWQILTKLVIPGSIPEFISVLKINVGLTWVGTIMGEYLVSRAGLGYQIIYGGQVFKLDLVMTSTVILCVLAAVMYFIVAFIEKKVNNSYKR